MEFESTELPIIKECLEERVKQLNKFIEGWKGLEWENLGNMQDMYASKQAFYDYKQMVIENWESSISQMENIIDKIYENL